MKTNVLLLGSYGRGNAGDDALLVAIIHLFEGSNLAINVAHKELLPDDELVKQATKILTTTNRDWKTKIEVLLRADILVYGGGDLWVELYEDRFPRLSLWKMFIVNLCARLMRKKVYYLGCGAGDLQGFSLSLARSSAYLANFIIARDEKTIQILGVKEHSTLLPDATINLDCVQSGASSRAGIGINALYHLPSPEEHFPLLAKALSELACSQVHRGREVRYIPFFQSKYDGHDDVWAMREIAKMAEGSDTRVPSHLMLTDILRSISECELVVGARLHANILSVLQGVPSVGISYRPKVRKFFESVGLGKYVIDLSELHLLSEKVEWVFSNYAAAESDFKSAKSQLTLARAKYAEIAKSWVD